MALYFLLNSPTYVSKTEKDIFLRRQVICQYLNEVYKVPKFKDDEVCEKIVQELATKGVAVTNDQYQTDKIVLRQTYLWLNENDVDKKAKIADRRSPYRGVIKYLTADGLLAWADLFRQEAPAPQLAAEEQTSPSVPKPKLAEHQAGQEVIGSFNQLAASLENMLEENESLKEENRRLSNQHEDYEVYLQYVEGENATLEERLRTARQGMRHTHSATLEEIAAEHPEFPQLLVIAQQLKETPTRRQEQFEKLASCLPQTFNWFSDHGAMIYELHFLRALLDLHQDEKEQVIKQMTVLSNFGSLYSSLHTRKNEIRLPYSPTGCMTSRGSETLRFSWKKNGDIKVFWLYRKGDTRVRQSEA